MGKFSKMFTLLLLFSIFAFCLAETEENHATIDVAPKVHDNKRNGDRPNTPHIITTVHKTVNYFFHTPTTTILSDAVAKIKTVFHKTVRFTSNTWRYMTVVRPNLSKFCRDRKLLAAALHQMERQTIDYDPEQMATTSVDIPDLRSLEIRMNALTAGLRPEEVTGLALQLEKVIYAGYSTYVALGSLAPRLKATAQFAQDVTSVAIRTLAPATVRYAQEFGSAVLEGPGRWIQTLFGPLFKMIFGTIIAISIGGVIWLKPRPCELIMILVLIIVIILLLIPDSISELYANFQSIRR